MSLVNEMSQTESRLCDVAFCCFLRASDSIGGLECIHGMCGVAGNCSGCSFWTWRYIGDREHGKIGRDMVFPGINIAGNPFSAVRETLAYIGETSCVVEIRAGSMV